MKTKRKVRRQKNVQIVLDNDKFHFIEIANELGNETFFEKIGFRNKRKEQKIFNIGSSKLLKCR